MRILTVLFLFIACAAYSGVLIGPEGGWTLGYQSLALNGYSYQGITLGGSAGTDLKIFQMGDNLKVNVNLLINYRYQDILSVTGDEIGYLGQQYFIHITDQKIGLSVEPVLVWKTCDGFDLIIGGKVSPSWRMMTTFSLDRVRSTNLISGSPFALSVTPLAGMEFNFSKHFGIILYGGYEFELLSVFPNSGLYMNNIWFEVLLDFKFAS